MKIFKNKKALQQKAKGLESLGSPGRSIGRTFNIVFKLQNQKGKLKIAIRE